MLLSHIGGAISDDGRILRALSGSSAQAWKAVSWRLMIPGDKTMPWCAIIDEVEAELRPAFDHSSYAITLIRRGVRWDYGTGRPLADAKRRAYDGVQHLLAWKSMRGGVPSAQLLLRYSHNLWAAKGPDMPTVILGRFVRSNAGTLRFSSDLRDYYEHRDELSRWEFAPLSASHNGVIRGWDL
jgi:hypothetical protein